MTDDFMGFQLVLLNVSFLFLASVLSHKTATEGDVMDNIANVLDYAPDNTGGGGRGNNEINEN